MTTSTTASIAAASNAPLIYPDILSSVSEDASAAFFELANANQIAYRLPPRVTPTTARPISTRLAKKTKTNDDAESLAADVSPPQNDMIIIHQDVSACLQHTGGIVWETCYLLLAYLTISSTSAPTSLGSVLEVGAGCGLLGQGLAAATCPKQVVLTEHPEAFDNLHGNLQRNRDTLGQRAPTVPVDGCVLDWLALERDIAANGALLQNAFDTIVGTDVLFSPRLVGPLLQTLRHFSHAQTVIYLCVQIRCAVSHDMLLQTAGDYDFVVADISQEVYSIKACEWAQEMECVVLRLVRVK